MTTNPLRSRTASITDEVTPTRRKRRTLQHVSRHFAQPQAKVSDEGGHVERKKRRKVAHEKENDTLYMARLERSQDASIPKQPQRASKAKSKEKLSTKERAQAVLEEDAFKPQPSSDLWQQVLAAPAEKQSRVFFGLLVDEQSSDSDLTDVPDDIGPDPFLEKPLPKTSKARRRRKKSEAAELVAVKEPKPKKTPKPKDSLTKSPYFPHAHKPRPTFLSTLPFPPLHLERFGLMQERLCHDPFRLLLATIFLNKTPGSRAMPIFYKLMEKYPTPKELAQAEQADVTEIIRELGFQNQRARKVIAMAKKWIEKPPTKGQKYRKVDYPDKGNGKDIKPDEVIDDTDERVAWEISHLPGLGPYSHDSWRMFCRDELRGLSTGYNGEDAIPASQGKDFEPEWKRVLPADKELRAWMTWMWMKEGWVWNKETGERTAASEELMDLARGKGNVVLEEHEKNTLIVKSLEENQPSPLKLAGKEKRDVRVEAPAGDFLPNADHASGKAQGGNDIG